jgi:hypothetical protein
MQTWLSWRTQSPPVHRAKVSHVVEGSSMEHGWPSSMTVGQVIVSVSQSPTRHRARSPQA